MNNINPSKTLSWNNLYKHFLEIKNISIKELFKSDKNRFNNFSILFEDYILLDFSKNIINYKTINLLINLSKELRLSNAICNLFSGNILNRSDNLPILHYILRCKNSFDVNYKNKNTFNNVIKCLEKIKIFCNKINNEELIGYSNKNITNLINIDIDGYSLTTKMVIESLKNFKKNNLSINFISNMYELDLDKIDHSTSLFIIYSKYFSSKEIIYLEKIKNWFIDKSKLSNLEDLNKHFIIVSSNTESCKKFGISDNNLFNIFNWINKRFSIWSSVGISIALLIGYKNFENFLYGAYLMDNHFKLTTFEKNIPVILALISIWYNNFFNFEIESIITFHNNLKYFSLYYQNLLIESNVQNIDRNNKKINEYKTSQIPISNLFINNNYFYKFLNNLNKIIPCDLIAISKNYNDLFNEDYNNNLSNFLTQSSLLAFGDNTNKSIFNGNIPNNILFIKELNPLTLGSLMSIYEHKIFVQGIILNIYSFNQNNFLNNKMHDNILNYVKNNKNCLDYDYSTNNLIKLHNFWKKEI